VSDQNCCLTALSPSRSRTFLPESGPCFLGKVGHRPFPFRCFCRFLDIATRRGALFGGCHSNDLTLLPIRPDLILWGAHACGVLVIAFRDHALLMKIVSATRRNRQIKDRLPACLSRQPDGRAPRGRTSNTALNVVQ